MTVAEAASYTTTKEHRKYGGRRYTPRRLPFPAWGKGSPNLSSICHYRQVFRGMLAIRAGATADKSEASQSQSMIDTSVSRHSMHPAICQSRILPCDQAATSSAREIRQTLIRQRIRGGLGLSIALTIISILWCQITTSVMGLAMMFSGPVAARRIKDSASSVSVSLNHKGDKEGLEQHRRFTSNNFATLTIDQGESLQVFHPP